MSLVTSFEWRYATKKYNTSKKIDPAVFKDLTETVRLAPSSFGLQPYKFLLIEDKSKLEEISRAAHGQPQITTGAHVMVLAVETNIDEKTVASYIDKAATARQTERKNLEPREQFVNTVLSKLDYNQRIIWAEKQAFLAVGVFVSAAAEAGIDASPMEGFDNATVDAILGLKEKNLTSALLFVIGYRSEEDEFAAIPKVRKPKEEIFQTI
ncbi:nitroreductase family protein [Mucilaginibacter sp. SMC90]|uniref:nitroreductase family protein n=1 Tax=Mucilaginibacter sp. SMC90 TaxID=2929803 RepID=UPI001FB54119|nr:nitroreductase family protein [Mucilaginibacter sp. SMC90]UOE47389.1 nitroreductase family protein [Mucilaginibacter sp. SMC90]